MKHRTLITITVLLSLFLSAIPVRAMAMTGEIKKSAQIPATFNGSLAAITNTLPDGHHDNFAGVQSPFFCRVDGWAADPDDRSLHLNVKIFSDGVEVAQTVADTFRQDLADAEVCTGGTCSFSVSLWSIIAPDADHVIKVQAEDAQTGEWFNLYDTPKTLKCFTPQAGTFIVNSTADDMDANPGDGVCEAFNPGECTLRAAITEANASPGMDTIRFSIPGAGPHTISPTYGFDFISDPVIIDGTTQPGFAGTPVIELDGSNAGPDAYGLVIFAGSSTVRGLVINRFSLTGIDLDVNGGNTIQGNYIGTDLTGTIALGNVGNGVAVSQGSSSNLIGGITTGARNLISGNGQTGIVITDTNSNGNVIEGNYIGTDITGSVDLGNHGGVAIAGGASDTIVGGTEASARNLISGNDCPGIAINSTGTTGTLVQGNFIGTDATGTQPLGNGCEGVFIGSGASNNIIGGTLVGTGNLISGNNGNGVTIADVNSTGNLLQGNLIGTDVSGTLSLGNTDDGVVLTAPNNNIGGTTSAARNVISGNQEQGIRLQGSEAAGNAVQGNFIGLDRTGTIALGNGTDCCHSGIVLHLGASNNTIGGNMPGAGNVISGNTADGVTIMDAGTTGNIIAGNFIGSDLTGTRNVANSSSGITIFDGPSANIIGGTANGAGNTIAFNNDNGVVLSMSSGSRNGILANSIYSNGNLGIDLGQDGVTPNDLFDLDLGPNHLQNSPVMTMVKSTSKGTVIQGVLISNVDTTLRLEFFSNNACDTSGYGEGQTYLGAIMVKTNTTGHVNFRAALPVTITTGNFVTATASDPEDNTSEFSLCVRVGT